MHFTTKRNYALKIVLVRFLCTYRHIQIYIHVHTNIHTYIHTYIQAMGYVIPHLTTNVTMRYLTPEGLRAWQIMVELSPHYAETLKSNHLIADSP